MNNPVDCEDALYESLRTAAMEGGLISPYLERYVTLKGQLEKLIPKINLRFNLSAGLPKGKKFHTGGYTYGSLLANVTHVRMRNEVETLLGETLPQDPISSALVSVAVNELSIVESLRFTSPTEITIVHAFRMYPIHFAIKVLRYHVVNRPVINDLPLGTMVPQVLSAAANELDILGRTLAAHMELECEFDPRKYATVMPELARHSISVLKVFETFRIRSRIKFRYSP